MDTGMITDVMRDAVGVVIKLGGPMLVLSMLAGVVVAIFQAVTHRIWRVEKRRATPDQFPRKWARIKKK